MGIGTFGAFTQARLAIYAAQTGISVTGNNISNINTPGYTRQRLNQASLNVAGSDRWYAQGDVRSGQGVLAKSISQIRNPYLDIRFREENAKVGYQNARLEGLDSIARILDEVGKGVDNEKGFGIVAQEINSLISALQNLTTETGHQEYDNIVRQVASNLVSRLNGYAARLEEVRQNTITSFDKDVDRINDILNSIRTYNEEIRICEIHGDPALELRDQRNLLLDELSGLIDISVTYDEEVITAGITVEKLVVRLGNANSDASIDTDESLLIDGVYAAQLSKGTPAKSPYYGSVNLDELTDEQKQALIDELKGRKGIDVASFASEMAMLEAYVNTPYLKQEKDEDGNIIKETLVSDVRDATILTGEDNSNYDIMVTELRNKIGELYKSMKTYTPTQVNGDPTITTDSEGKPINGGAGELLSKLLDDNGGVYTTKVKDQPERGDATITIYKKNKDGTVTSQVIEQLVSKPVALDDNDLGGELQANRELLTEKGEFVDASVITNVDESALSKRGIQYYQRSLDLLANQLARLFNDANKGFYVDPDGNYVSTKTKIDENGKEVALPATITLADNTEHTLNQNEDLDDTTDAKLDGVRDALLAEFGLADEQEMKAAGLTYADLRDAYLKGQTYNSETKGFEDKDPPEPVGIFVGGNLFSNGNNSDDDTDITASNISISKTWQTQHILVQDFTCPDGKTEPASGASENIRHMVYLLDTQKWDFNANQLKSTSNALDGPMFNGTIYEFWNNVGFTMGKDQDYANTELTVAYETALSIDTDRSSVSSVDFNDEAMNLMMYSKSYNAACRLMTTIDSMIDKLVNGTGMTT